MTSLEVVFWGALLVILYAYVGYPALLWIVCRLTSSVQEIADNEVDGPLSLTILISAYNEESVVGEKIRNALALDYPEHLVEIVVVSDGSTDRTDEIVRSFAADGVVLRRFEGRIGKTACLNQAVPMAQGQVVIFSDANSIYERGAIRALLHPFQDRSIGFATGWTTYRAGESASDVNALGLYSRLELFTKEQESLIGSCIGADGAIFAIRKHLYAPLEATDINDLVIPLSICEMGYRGVLVRAAVCRENDAGSAKGEFHRQVRISTRTIRAIVRRRRLLNPLRFRWLSFEILSHKVGKLLVPFLLITAFVSNAFLLGTGCLYNATFVAQVAFYLAAWMGPSDPWPAVVSRVGETARTFVVVNAAIATAWFRYLQGKTYTTWSPTKRQ